jgi:hypothetical protein
MLDDVELELELEGAQDGEVEAGPVNKAPVGTGTSAKDAREVEEVVGLFDGEGDVPMGGGGEDIAPMDVVSRSPHPTSKSKSKPMSKPVSKKKVISQELFPVDEIIS